MEPHSWCVQDGNHVMMFRKNAGSYLHELMRLDAAVQQFTTALDKEETMVLEGHKALWIILNLVKDISDFLVGPQTRAISFLSLGIIAMNIAHV